MSLHAMGKMNSQLTLSMQLNDEISFVDFCWYGNEVLQAQFNRVLAGQGERLFYLWGNPGCGKTHVLQAACNAIPSSIYLPLDTLKEWGPEVLEGLDERALIAIDDIDAITGDPIWEEALFHLYNRIRDQGKSILIISGKTAPTHIAIQLPDLRSRLTWGMVFQLHELNDENKIGTLQLHAKNRGFDLPATVCQYLLTRYARNMHDLHVLLNRLDDASLVAQRKITIPFVKEVLG